jgi:ABC-type multidrug transport system fused ATPase/permease subunit
MVDRYSIPSFLNQISALSTQETILLAFCSCAIVLAVYLICSRVPAKWFGLQNVMNIAIGGIIIIAVGSTLTVGLLTPRVMIGDEVTHYYMLTHQADDFSYPNFFAHIPTSYGETEIRRYPHSFLWHYLGAIVYQLSGKSVVAVQVYQSAFFLQLLVVAYLLSRARGGLRYGASYVYVLTIASLPAVLIFSVAFYQDIPMVAQVLTAFYLLTKRKWVWAVFFIAFAILLKITAILFLPAFLLYQFILVVKNEEWKRGLVIYVGSLVLIFGSIILLGKMINLHAYSSFYPLEKFERILENLQNNTRITLFNEQKRETWPSAENNRKHEQITEQKQVIIANHPGDLRIKRNYIIYGGVVLWFVLGGGAIILLLQPWLKTISSPHYFSGWSWVTGGSFLLFTFYFTRTGPDARFFVPGLLFILLPLCERFARLPKIKVVMAILTSLALFQGSMVLAKVYDLRSLNPSLREAITFLYDHPPTPPKIFMYPEGNYRYFPVPHEWYLGYRLREFWRADNDTRIKMLIENGVGAIVIKKYLISSVDDKITDLGVYPNYFYEELKGDQRYLKEFENESIIIYQLKY